MLEALQDLDSIRLNFSKESLFILNLTLAFIMFGVALEIKISAFKKLILRPKPTVIGVISQFVMLPAVTFLLLVLFQNYVTPTVALGMILVSSCPGGNISNFISSLAKGNIELSVSLTAVATLGAIIMTPLNFAFWGGLYNRLLSKAEASALLRPLEIDASQMFQTVFILLGIPLLIGIFISYQFPAFTNKIVKPIKTLSILIFIGIVVMAFSNNYQYFIEHIYFIFLIVLIHNSVALITGYSFSSFFGITRRERRSVTIETGIQNSGLGLVLIFNPKIFPDDLHIGGMAFIAAWWGIWHILAGLGIAWFWSGIKIPEGKKNQNK